MAEYVLGTHGILLVEETDVISPEETLPSATDREKFYPAKFLPRRDGKTSSLDMREQPSRGVLGGGWGRKVIEGDHMEALAKSCHHLSHRIEWTYKGKAVKKVLHSLFCAMLLDCATDVHSLVEGEGWNYQDDEKFIQLSHVIMV